MGQQQLIMAIGRIERALSRIEQVPRPVADIGGDTDLIEKHERLKAETKAAISDLDQILAGQAG